MYWRANCGQVDSIDVGAEWPATPRDACAPQGAKAPLPQDGDVGGLLEPVNTAAMPGYTKAKTPTIARLNRVACFQARRARFAMDQFAEH